MLCISVYWIALGYFIRILHFKWSGYSFDYLTIMHPFEWNYLRELNIQNAGRKVRKTNLNLFLIPATLYPSILPNNDYFVFSNRLLHFSNGFIKHFFKLFRWSKILKWSKIIRCNYLLNFRLILRPDPAMLHWNENIVWILSCHDRIFRIYQIA